MEWVQWTPQHFGYLWHPAATASISMDQVHLTPTGMALKFRIAILHWLGMACLQPRHGGTWLWRSPPCCYFKTLQQKMQCMVREKE